MPSAPATSSSSTKRVGKYEVGRTLGEGTFGKVKAATDTETGEKVRASSSKTHFPLLSLLPHPSHPARVPALPRARQVAIKVLDKDKIQKQNMGPQIKKEVRRRNISTPLPSS